MTPIKHILVQEYDIFTVDWADKETYIATATTPEVAEWIGRHLASVHDVGLVLEANNE